MALKLPAIDEKKQFDLETPQSSGFNLDQFGLAAPVSASELTQQKCRPKMTQEQPKVNPNGSILDKSARSLSIWERINTEEKDAQGKLLPKQRFKKLARMIKTNVVWAKDISDKQDDGNSNAFVVKADNNSTLVFDKDIFKTKHLSYGGISNKARRILAKSPLERTEDDLTILTDVVDRLKCFVKYPRKVKQELARVICYEIYDSGRVIIQQGHVGQSFYFIIRGSVQVSITDIDKKTGLRRQKVVGVLSEGSSFGELALMHNIKRTATIICVDKKSEFLRVDKQDFESVLKVSHERENNERMRILRNLQTTREWSESDLLNLNNHCKLKEFPANKIIYGDTDSVPDNIYFIVSGNCRIVRQIDVVRVIHEYGQHSFHLPMEEDLKNIDLSIRRGGTMGKTQMTERHYWTIGTISRGHFFGVGEDMLDTFVITQNRVECLTIPRVQFLRSGKARTLEQMKEDMENCIPNNKQLFKLYFSECKWDKYKQGLVKELVRKLPRRTHTTIDDVPYMLRVDSIRSLGNDQGYMDI